ncbi:MAG: uncharacterized protein QOG04_1351 [Actinomycetota bacterium]|jgi:uncharacterized protein (DUF1684 family)|nr:uncharacterized protein [Actinomycetota bacterium]
MESKELLELADWRRRVFNLYREVRDAPDPQVAWRRWRDTRDELFRTHPQSPLPASRRADFEGVSYFDYDPASRVIGRVRDLPPRRYNIETSGEGTFSFTRFAAVAFTLHGSDLELELYWLEGYGGGIFLPFKDQTSGRDTYGGGRYLLDTVKGADLGDQDGGVVLDLNFAYNPSCSYDPQWVCPLSPPENRLDIAVTAGEQKP